MAEVQGHPRRWWTLIVLCLSMLIIALDNTILNVALPTLVRELDASASELQWIVDAYVLVFAGLLLLAGSLGDKFGRKRALFAGYGIFAATSVLAAYADSSTQLIAVRALMGVGGALIMPATLSILVNVFPRYERPRAIAIWAATAGIGVPVGPVVGGWLLDHYWWGSIFLINIPVVVVAGLAGIWLVPESRDEHAPAVDVMGGILSIAGLASLLYAIIEAPNHGWTAPSTLLGFAVSFVILTLFVWWERRVPAPMLNLAFFRNARFSAGAASIALVFFSLFGSIFLFTQYLQFILGYTPLEAGLRITPVAVGIAVGTGLGQRLVRLIGTKLVVAGGLTVVAGGLLLGSTLDPDSSYATIAAMLIIFGFGMGNVMAPATDAVMGAVPEANAGVGSAVNDTTRQIGGALGVAVLGSLFSTIYTDRMQRDIPASLPDEVRAVASDSVGGALQIATNIGGSTGQALAQAAQASFTDGMNGAFLAAAGVAMAGSLLALRFLPARETTDNVRETPQSDDVVFERETAGS